MIFGAAPRERGPFSLDMDVKTAWSLIAEQAGLLWRRAGVDRNNLLILAWLVMFATILMSPSRAVISWFFYGGCVVSLLCFLRDWRQWSWEGAKPYWLPIAFLSLLGISIFYGENLPSLPLKKSLPEWLYTCVFCLWTVQVFRPPQNRDYMFSAIRYTAITATVLNLFFYAVGYAWQLESYRIVPLGVLGHTTIIAGILYAILAMLALDHALKTRNVWWFMGFIAMFMLVFVTYSRGALGALTLASLLRVSMEGLSRKTILVIVFSMAAMMLFTVTVIMPDHLIHSWVERGSSYRVGIWKETLEHVAQSPVFGYGLSTDFARSVIDFSHPHNLYIGLLYYTGVLGFGLFVAMFAYGLYRFYGASDIAMKHRILPIIALWLTVSLVEGGKFIDGASGYLLYFWMPVMWLYALSFKQERQP